MVLCGLVLLATDAGDDNTGDLPTCPTLMDTLLQYLLPKCENTKTGVI